MTHIDEPCTCLTPHCGWTPCDITVTYTFPKSAFNGLQFCRRQYVSISIRLAVIASETREMSRNSKRIWPYSSSRSSKVIDLVVNGKPICDVILVINCNFSRMLLFSRYSRLKIDKKAQLSLTTRTTRKHAKNCSNSTCLQRCRWQYWPIFIRLVVVVSEMCKIPRNSLKIQPYRVEGHRMSSILVSMESPYATSY